MIQPTNQHRVTRLLVVVAVFLGLLTSSPSGATATEATDEAQFVTLINDLRATRGLTALEVHPQLVPPSRDWATQMATTGTLAHAPDLSVGVTVYWTKLGENVGVAPQGPIQQLFDAFVASPAHLQNLVDPQFRYVGIGVVYDQSGQMWTTHRFMTLGDAPAATTTTRPATTSTPGRTPATQPGGSTATTAPPTTPTTVPSTTTSSSVPATLPPNNAGPLAPTSVAAVLASMAGSGI